MTRQTPFYLSLCFVFIAAISGVAQDAEANCSIMQQGVFTSELNGEQIKVVIKGNRCMAYRDNGKHMIKSKMDWISPCEYKLTLMNVSVPNYPFQIGDVLNVKIDKVEGEKVHYTTRVPGETEAWPGIFTKLVGQ